MEIEKKWNDIDLTVGYDAPLQPHEIENAVAFLCESSDFEKHEFGRVILLRIAATLKNDYSDAIKEYHGNRI